MSGIKVSSLANAASQRHMENKYYQRRVIVDNFGLNSCCVDTEFMEDDFGCKDDWLVYIYFVKCDKLHQAIT